MKKYMSVKEMGDLLGIKKTDRYWLLKKGYFKVVTIAGKMWVDTASFEEWYAHQVKYHKVTGERSENEIRSLSYAPKEAAALLGVSEWLIYELIKSRHLKTIKVDGWTRILKDDFYAWYAKQDRYQIIERKGEIRKKQPEKGPSVKSIPVGEVAVLLGISNQEMHRVSEEYPDLLETIDVNGKTCFTEKGLDLFFRKQSRYLYHPENDRTVVKRGGELYLTIQQACWTARVTRPTITSWYCRGKIPVIRFGKVVRIPLSGLEKWLRKRKEKKDGINQKTRKIL